ncbi:MAG: response regulator transcription factor [Actinobacteria bacterium]|nr:response regulator transcription factor [Actinomycetota bacterium]
MRVVVCDDAGLFRRRMIVGLEIERDIEVIGECDDAEQAIRVCRDLAPDVAFVGMQLSQIGGVRTTAGIREVIPACKVVVVLSAEDHADAVRAIRAGAVGFLSRDDAVPRAALTTRQVASGQVVVPPVVAAQMLIEVDALGRLGDDNQPRLAPPRLTTRERQALEQVGDNVQPEHTAGAMNMPVASVHNLAASAVLKLHRYARSEAVMYTVADKLFGV